MIFQKEQFWSNSSLVEIEQERKKKQHKKKQNKKKTLFE